jgi:hypothetical protein
MRALILMLLAAPGLVHAWGSDGHSIVAEIAQRRLDAGARAQVEALLGPGHSLASESTWADDVREARPATFNWHFVDIPVADSTYDAAAVCPPTPKGDCVVAEIERLRTQLKCGSEDARREALKFAVHFIGDLHQPLHTVAEEKGGNGIKVDYEVHGLRCPKCTPRRTQENLHAVWDTSLIASTVWGWGAYLTRLDATLASEAARGADGGTPRDWALEAHAQAQRIWPLLREDHLVDDTYYNAVLPVVDVQLARAGLRLARFLNESYAAAPSCESPQQAATLRFSQVYRLPAGPRGLEPGAEFIALDGKTVRLAGYPVRLAKDDARGFVLSPLPVTLGDEDESFADDLPPSALYVSASPGADIPARIVTVTGVLHVGPTRSPDGRIFPARIDPVTP